MEGNKHFKVQRQSRPDFWFVGFTYAKMGKHLSVWFHLATKCLMLEFKF